MVGPGVRAGVSRDSRDMAKAGLLEAESPEDATYRLPERHPKPAPRSATANCRCRRNLRGVERCPARAIKEMSRTPTSRSDVQQGRTRDQPSGRVPQGDGVPIVVVGVRALPVSARQAALHPKEGRDAAPAGSAVVVGQAARRSDPPAVGGVLRAAVLRALPRLPARPGLPHRLARGGGHLDRGELVYRG